MLNAVIDEIPTMVAIWDRDLRYCLVNKQFERWRKKSRTEVIGKTVAEVTTAFEYERSRPHIERALQGETVRFEKEYPEDAEITHVVSTYSPLVLEDGQVGGIVAVAHDISRQHAESERLKLLSERDELTSLMNRAGFEAFLATASTTSLGTMLGLIYIDLDEFKPVNDRYGHAAGDEVLRIFAQRLQRIVRPTDGIARLGGDEFAVVLLGLRNEDDARRVANKIVAIAKQPMVALAHSIQISASVGVAFDGSLELGWRGLIARADRMVYDAKLSGRGRSSVETDGHRSKA
jgi:diguanylate cyclase (GGDEF)-like protein/PAS domain S-box-containing protein